MASIQNKEQYRTPRTGGRLPPGLGLLLPTLLPLGLLVMAMILPGFMFESDQTASTIGLGPAAWPEAILMAMAVFCVLWIARDVWALGAAGRRPTLSFPVEDDHYHFGKALIGLLLIIAYGWSLPVFGFAVTTTIFIMIWCLFGGLRNVLVLIPVTVIGTIGLMWLFMGLALMPLPRGYGVFDNFSIWLLRATGIY
ncbi:tripartite tricarboxylate transporter TctB family protein [Yoonia sp.]|uniref:tripartite tricarboxylate transporter TctB family protein n=1 Tax=Yoonia sp. TaxID=2212373 RepID=UPI002E068DA0|nr:tripartite tricarboxylate transporter TctB family protein [Yoonia sp.]